MHLARAQHYAAAEIAGEGLTVAPNMHAHGSRWLRDSAPNERDERLIRQLHQLLSDPPLTEDGRVFPTRTLEIA